MSYEPSQSKRQQGCKQGCEVASTVVLPDSACGLFIICSVFGSSPHIVAPNVQEKFRLHFRLPNPGAAACFGAGFELSCC